MAANTTKIKESGLKPVDQIALIAMDIDGFVTAAQAMQENIWDYMELSGMSGAANSFNDSLVVMLGHIRLQSQALLAVQINE